MTNWVGLGGGSAFWQSVAMAVFQIAPMVAPRQVAYTRNGVTLWVATYATEPASVLRTKK